MSDARLHYDHPISVLVVEHPEVLGELQTSLSNIYFLV